MSGARPKEYQQGSSYGSDRKQRRSTSGSRDGRPRIGTGVGEQQSGSDKQMVTYVIQLLCLHGGQAKVSDLENYVQQQQQPQQQQSPSLLAVMTRNPQQFTLFRLGDDDVLAKVRTDLKLCANHCTGAGCNAPTCDALHVCKYFLISSCSAEKKQIECDYGHDFGTYYNLTLLQIHGLEGLRPQDLQLIFKLNRSEATLPMICRFYNRKKTGCNKAGGKGCPGMHICKRFLKNRCKSGEKCPRSHNVLDLQPKNILLQYGFNIRKSPGVVLQDLLGQMENCSSGRTRDSSQEQGYVRPHPTSPAALPAATVSSNNYVKPPKMATTLVSAPPRDADDDGELNICMFFLRGECLYGDECHNKHSRRHFQWQREQSNTAKGTWADFNAKENLELELNFSNPNREECVLGDPTRVLKVDFTKMILQERGQAVQVRRLGTTSSVLAPPTYKGTTQWLWFWRDSAQKWIEYGNPDTNEGFEAGITSAELEEFFHQSKSSKVWFGTTEYGYELDFATMTQVNLSVGTGRPVRRRPVFDKETDYTTQSSPKDIVALLKDLKQRLEEARLHKTSETIPPHWDFEHVSDNDYFHALPVLMSGSTLAECIKIKKLFHKTLPGKTIKCIKRIQNFDLWEKFQRKKIKMERKLKSGDTLDERLLFHGTSKKCIDAICQQGFDWRYFGTSTGALYGNGSYFARDAKYSNCYSEDSTMFVARVLVGKFAQGSSGERLPPVKDPKWPYGERYDSSVDDPSDPSIFVIYQDDQSYPEYLIEY